MAYVAVLAVAAILLYGRHLQELRYPDEASGGMWAAGDAILYFFIACLFMFPTVFLIWVISKFEAFYTAYSKFLLGLSLTAPVCLGLVHLGENRAGESLFALCFGRLVCFPFIFVGIGISRWVARSDRAKRFASWALLIEGLTFATAVALVIRAWGASQNH